MGMRAWCAAEVPAAIKTLPPPAHVAQQCILKDRRQRHRSESTTNAYFEGSMSADFSLAMDCRVKDDWAAAANAAPK